jgi:predicted Zn-dependent protease
MIDGAVRVEPPAIDADRGPSIMSEGECQSLFQRVVQLTRGVGEVTATVESKWRGNVRWANNGVITTGDTTDHLLTIYRRIRGAAAGTVTTNQFDDDALTRALAFADYQLQFQPERFDPDPWLGAQQYPDPPLFYESTANLVAAERSRIGELLTEPVARAGLRAAGYLAVESRAVAAFTTSGLKAYSRVTDAQYSVTVRNAHDTGSGWAGIDRHDWSKIDGKAITERAQHKCVASADPRAVEPGRYVTILEPQAVHDLMQYAVMALDRVGAERGGPYHLADDRSKLGHRVMDPRVTISTDPMDPECSYVPFVAYAMRDCGEPYRKVSWITDGILTNLSYSRTYAVEWLGHQLPQLNPLAYRMSGGETTVEEMIATTERGVLVTRLSGMHMIDISSILMTGVTRDGLWLVEKGKVKHAIKNFRFNESPLFVFNAIEQMGKPVRVFSPGAPAVVPPVKVRDFNFTALADAV